MKLKGKIEKKEETGGSNAKGPWTRWAFKIDGKSYSTFNADIGTKFSVDEFVEIETKPSPDGKYENMVSMVKAENNGVQDVVSSQTDDLLRQILAELKDGNKKNETTEA